MFKYSYIIILLFSVACGSSGSNNTNGASGLSSELLFGDWDVQLVGANTGNCPDEGQVANQDISIDPSESSPVAIKIKRVGSNGCEILGASFYQLQETVSSSCQVSGNQINIKYKGYTQYDDFDLNGGDCTQIYDVSVKVNLVSNTTMIAEVSGAATAKGVCAQMQFGVNEKTCNGSTRFEGTKKNEPDASQDTVSDAQSNAGENNPAVQVGVDADVPLDDGANNLNPDNVVDNPDPVPVPDNQRPAPQVDQERDIVAPEVIGCLMTSKSINVIFNETILTDADASFVVSHQDIVGPLEGDFLTRGKADIFILSDLSDIFTVDERYHAVISGIRDSSNNRRDDISFDFTRDRFDHCSLENLQAGNQSKSCLVKNNNGIFEWKKCGAAAPAPFIFRRL